MKPTNELRAEIHQLHAHLCNGLADPNRILILYALNQAACSVSELAQQTNLPQPSVSRHLRVLRESRLVAGLRNGYQLTDERVIDALDVLRKVLATSLKNQSALVLSSFEPTYERN